MIVSINQLVELMDKLTPEERIEVMAHYCSECGKRGVPCCPVEEEPKIDLEEVSRRYAALQN